MTGNDVFELRWRLGLTQKDLGDELGVTDETIRRWEAGRTKLGRLQELALFGLAKRGVSPITAPVVRWGSPRWIRYHPGELAAPRR